MISNSTIIRILIIRISTSVQMADDVPDKIDNCSIEADDRLYNRTMANYTGQKEVIIEVGAGDVGFVFAQPAIRIAAGTIVTWEWIAEGGAHNVVSADASATRSDSGDPTDELGYTFEQTFDATGIQLYYCTPHRASSKSGAIEVI